MEISLIGHHAPIDSPPPPPTVPQATPSSLPRTIAPPERERGTGEVGTVRQAGRPSAGKKRRSLRGLGSSVTLVLSIRLS